ncbi:RNA polymerase sigma factor [Streptomyces sp. NPDC059477]|uniref:RNA polymerase sigma factor n=1 Tax=Streptomyces sp. NPDC059477 TaxID=3346847 RepID=UPI003686FE32
MESDDDDLLTRSARDPVAFEPLVERHAGVLHGYLARRAPAAADDLLAEVWLQAYASRAGFDAARGTARTWLFGVARNVLAAHWRRSGREREQAGAPGDRADSDPWQGVDERLDAAAVAPFLRRTIAGLPHVERELLLLVAWERLTPTEAAAVVGIPPGTARSRLHRARARLREALASTRTSVNACASTRTSTGTDTNTLHPTGDLL